MFTDIIRSYTIAFAPRSGSNVICELLRANGLGAPHEWFQEPPVPEPGQIWLDGFVAFVNAHQAEHTFASKMGHDHRARLDECLREAVPGYHSLDDLLPHHRWVWLLRKDKVLQAISLCRAQQSGIWATTEAGERAIQSSDYDFFHILSNLMIIQAGEYAWKLYFQQHGINPFVVVYEDFFESLDHQLSLLIDYLGGLPPSRRSVNTGRCLQLQRDARSYEQRERFISDLNRVGEESFLRDMGETNRRWERFFFGREWLEHPVSTPVVEPVRQDVKVGTLTNNVDNHH